MRTPVASIEGYLGLALNPATAQIDEKARDFINKAHESAQHLGRLFSDLLDVSKAEDGRLSNKPKVTDVVQFTHDVIEGLRPQAEAKGLRMLFKPLPDGTSREGERTISPVFFVNVDNDHLREVTANLVENAIKYTPHGDITIDVTGDNDHVTISVADSGIGIPKEDQVHLFQKFYRVDNSDTREIGGTGLGLYLSRRLAEAMNGRLWVESEYKQGSTFYLSLDRISHEDATRLIEAASNETESAPQITAVVVQPNVAAEPAPVAPVMQIQPPAAPIATPMTAPIAPPSVPRPAPAPSIRTAAPPLSISAIEQNADQYVQSTRRNMNIPPRA
jgi:K+-sensing histidine kinase KdpD